MSQDAACKIRKYILVKLGNTSERYREYQRTHNNNNKNNYNKMLKLENGV